jgi:hypothetical protein
MLMSLPAQLMTRQMVPFAMGSGCGAVGMGSKVVEFYKPFVRTGGHFASPGFASLDSLDVLPGDSGTFWPRQLTKGKSWIEDKPGVRREYNQSQSWSTGQRF